MAHGAEAVVIFDERLFIRSMRLWRITRYGCSLGQLQVFP